MDNYIVYMHIAPNGKKYIGITSRDPRKRWGSNGVNYKNNEYFYRAIDCYGWCFIEHKILFTHLSKEEAEQKEIELIGLYKSNVREHGYNIKNGGDSVEQTNETKEKISRALKGKIKTEETRERLSNALRGHSVSEDTRKKISQKLSGVNNVNYGKPRPKEVCEKISIAQRGEKSHRYGKTMSDEHKQILSKRFKGKKLSQEHIEKIIAAKARRVKDVAQINGGKTIAVYASASDAARKTGIERRNICSVCNLERNTAGGYGWRYV